MKFIFYQLDCEKPNRNWIAGALSLSIKDENKMVLPKHLSHKLLMQDSRDIHVFFGNGGNISSAFKECLKANANYIHIDHSYFARYNKKQALFDHYTFKVTYNSLIPSQNMSNRDLEPTVLLSEWKQDRSGKILLIPPTTRTADLFDCQSWTDDVINKISKTTDKEIILLEKNREDKNKSIHLYLKESFCCVTYNSKIAIDAAILGVPIFCEPKCPAFPIAQSDYTNILQPVFPERKNWLKNILNSEYSIQEMCEGTVMRDFGLADYVKKTSVENQKNAILSMFSTNSIDYDCS